MVRALASHQCVPGSIPGPASCGLSLLLVLLSAPRGFSPGISVFTSPQKPTFQIPILVWKVSPISARALHTFDILIKVIIIKLIIITQDTLTEHL